ADAQEAADIDDHGLDLAVSRDDDVGHLADVAVVSAVDGAADQLLGGGHTDLGQNVALLGGGSRSGVAGGRRSIHARGRVRARGGARGGGVATRSGLRRVHLGSRRGHAGLFVQFLILSEGAGGQSGGKSGRRQKRADHVFSLLICCLVTSTFAPILG